MTTPAERNGVAAPLWRLRILSGLHAGAEAILADNEETTIGGNDECDLVLQDDGLGDRHIHLSISDAGVRLKVLELEQPVFVDGLKVEDAADLKPYQVVAFGLSSFALGPAGQEWPNIDIPGIRETESETGGEQPRPESRHPSPVNGSDPGAGSAPALSEEAPPAGFRFRQRFRMHSSKLARLALLGPLLAIWMLMPKEIQQSKYSPDEANEQIRGIADRFGALVEVKPGGANGTRISVTGSIGTTRDRQRFLDELAATGFQVTAQITASEDLARVVSPILDQTLNLNRRNRVTVQALDESPGTLLISGYVENESDLSAAKKVLERDTGNQARFLYDVQTKTDRIEILRRRLDELGFENRLHIQQVGEGISLFGSCPSRALMARLIELAKDFNEEFDSRPPLRLTGNDTFLGQSTTDLDIRAVVLGDRKHIVLQDGKSYSEGSTIDNGYRIKTIEPEYIILEKSRTPVAHVDDESSLAYFILRQG